MSTLPEPTVTELINYAERAVVGSADKNADYVRGSDYEALAGPCAIIWSREAQRDTDLFNAVNFNTATGDDLTNLVKKRFGIDRILDTHGAGTVTLTRPISGIAETIWKGTRFLLTGSIGKMYRVTADTPVGSGLTTISPPIEAVEIGPGVAVTVSDSSGMKISIQDVLLDPTWKATALTCADGTLYEEAPAFRSRVRALRFQQRVGEEASIIAACKSAGATNVILFRSDYRGLVHDAGLNVCYVGDSGFTGSPTLVKACALALESARVEGDCMQVLQMAHGTVAIDVDVYLDDAPGKFNLTRLTAIHTAAINQYMNGVSGTFAYTLDGILGAIIRNTPEVQRVVFNSPTSDANILVGPDKNFPTVLTRYTVSSITLNYLAN